MNQTKAFIIKKKSLWALWFSQTNYTISTCVQFQGQIWSYSAGTSANKQWKKVLSKFSLNMQSAQTGKQVSAAGVLCLITTVF